MKDDFHRFNINRKIKFKHSIFMYCKYCWKKNIQHIIILLLIYTHFPCSLFMLNKTPLIVMYILQLPYSRYTVFSQLKTPGIYLFETLWT